MTACGKYEIQQALGISVDNPCGQPAESADGSPPHTPPLQKDMFMSAVVDGLAEAVQILGARVDGLEHLMAQYLAIVDQPLSPTECIYRLRQLREEQLI
jgi:hypothetical protein